MAVGGGSTRQTGEGMAAIAARHGVAVIEPESINTPDGVAALAAFAPDLLVVAAYGQILKTDVLTVPPRGAINVHASLLPKYRGASPIAHAILNGETTTGVTIIRITLGLDAGEMLAKAEVPIPPAHHHRRDGGDARPHRRGPLPRRDSTVETWPRPRRGRRTPRS